MKKFILLFFISISLFAQINSSWTIEQQRLARKGNIKDSLDKKIAFISAKQYGFSVDSSASSNVSVFNNLPDSSEIIISSGLYEINGTLKLKSNTTYNFDNVFLKKTGSFVSVLSNEMAFNTTTDRDSNIVIKGKLTIIVNGVQTGGAPAYALNGNINFYKLDYFKISGINIYDLGATLYGTMLVDVNHGIIEDCHMEGNKDGFDLIVGNDIVFRNIITKNHDDGIFLGGYGYPEHLPRIGDVTNVVIENWKDLYYPAQIGKSCRVYSASWDDWAANSSYSKGDAVVNGGNIYVKMTSGTNVASNAPIHTSGSVTGADGITWRFVQVGTIKSASVKNVTFKNCYVTANRDFLNLTSETNSYVRCIYPGTFGNGYIDNIKVDNIDWNPQNATTKYLLLISSNVKNITISNSHIDIGSTNIFCGMSLSDNNIRTAGLDKLLVDNCNIHIGSAATFLYTPPSQYFDGDNLIVSNSTLTTDNTTMSKFIYIKYDSTLTNLIFTNTVFNGIQSLVYPASGVTVNVNVSGCIFNNVLSVISVAQPATVNYSSINTIYNEPNRYLFETYGVNYKINLRTTNSRDNTSSPSKIYNGSYVNVITLDMPSGINKTQMYDFSKVTTDSTTVSAGRVFVTPSGVVRVKR